ncbi:hypothetical protein I3843_05G228600 [Carya illinoinensis]|uniref:Uncharacterized protein n=1 Tax=Carya illinoinensis TaxID=32201 RepID=A0A8T1QPT2_CARIL|nr:hypothetical protein CIPAW_05G255800 [Carya illinoinensis]KAG7981335.1 hypothetical protein I3843_05G228600 [Carya illinoinensis]
MVLFHHAPWSNYSFSGKTNSCRQDLLLLTAHQLRPGKGNIGEGGHEVLKLQNGQDGAAGVSCIESRSNPATNDWVPKINEDQVFVSSKPNRSESS